MSTRPTITLAAGDTVAVVAHRGAELTSWRVRGRELIWRGEPAFWSGQAPILFPVVGASAGSEVRVGGRAYPMPQHGFARNLDFDLIESGPDWALFRLDDSEETRRHYPFAFRLDVRIAVEENAVSLDFRVENRGEAAMPYSLGYHPAFAWPFDGTGSDAHLVLFDEPEDPQVPTIVAGGLLDWTPRRVALDGPRLPLSPGVFEEGALVFRNARSRRLRFVSPSGTANALEAPTCRHLAIWTRPGAPFVSMEAWTGYADQVGFSGELSERDSIETLGPNDAVEHPMMLRWTSV